MNFLIGNFPNLAKIKVLSVDYGLKKIGLADAIIENGVAFPRKVLIGNWSNIGDCVEKLVAIINTEKIGAMVIGYPLKMDGEIRENCINVLSIVESICLQRKMRKIDNSGFSKDFPVLLFDERFTTQATYAEEKHLNYASGRRGFQKNIKNKISNKSGITDDCRSACLMLNEVLGAYVKAS